MSSTQETTKIRLPLILNHMINFTRMKCIVLLVTLVFSVDMVAQDLDRIRVKLRSDDKTELDSLSKNYMFQIEAGVISLMSEYNNIGGLSDVNSGGRVTPKIMDEFSLLFIGNARVHNDLMHYGGQIEKGDYVNYIYQYFTNFGFPFDITDMYIAKVERNRAIKSLNFEVKLHVKKLVYKGIDEKSNTVINYPDGKLIPLDFTIIVQGDYLSDAKIYNIAGKIVPRPKPFNKEVAFWGSLGLPVGHKYSFHEGFKESDNINLKSKKMFDFGIKYMHSFKRGGHSKFILGLGYGIQNWEINSESDIKFTTESSFTPNKLSFGKNYVYKKNFLNQVNFTYIQAIVGLQSPIKKIQGFNFEYWWEANLLPTFVNKSESLSDSSIDELDVISYNNTTETYCISDFNDGILTTDQLKSNVFSLGTQLKSLVKYYPGSKKSALTIGIGYIYYLNSWIDVNTNSVHMNDSSPGSFLLKNLSPHQLRVEISFVRKL